MPRGDGTGPQGKGPATGWGRGRCVAVAENQPMNPARGRGRRCAGFNRGSGWGNTQRGMLVQGQRD